VRWNSCIYRGRVEHRRRSPRDHRFSMRLFMMCLDLDELPGVLDGRLLWSARRIALARFKRSDYLGDPGVPLADAVRARVREETGAEPTGPIRMVTHLRMFGYCFNPVTFYYCLDADGDRVQAIVAEVTNTPWGERHAYVLPADRSIGSDQSMRWTFDKDFHISPFMGMDQRYDWRFSPPGESLGVRMESREGGELVFDATLAMRRVEVTGRSLAWALIRHPLMTGEVIGRIYFEAMRLWLKRIPAVPHPSKLARRAKEATTP